MASRGMRTLAVAVVVFSWGCASAPPCPPEGGPSAGSSGLPPNLVFDTPMTVDLPPSLPDVAEVCPLPLHAVPTLDPQVVDIGGSYRVPANRPMVWDRGEAVTIRPGTVLYMEEGASLDFGGHCGAMGKYTRVRFEGTPEAPIVVCPMPEVDDAGNITHPPWGTLTVKCRDGRGSVMRNVIVVGGPRNPAPTAPAGTITDDPATTDLGSASVLPQPTLDPDAATPPPAKAPKVVVDPEPPSPAPAPMPELVQPPTFVQLPDPTNVRATLEFGAATRVENVVVVDSPGIGVWAAKFAEGSRNLVVARSHSYPVHLSGRRRSPTFPPGTTATTTSPWPRWKGSMA